MRAIITSSAEEVKHQLNLRWVLGVLHFGRVWLGIVGARAVGVDALGPCPLQWRDFGAVFFLFNDPFACLNEHVEAATEVVQAAIANRALGPCSP